MVGGVAGLLVAAALVAWGLILVLKKLPQRGITWRFGLANLRRRAFASSLQIGALALGLMALLLLTVVRGDLLRNWRASLPPDAPNQFIVNVLPEQVADARAQLAKNVGADVDVPADGARPARRGERRSARHDASSRTRARAGSPSASSTSRGREELPKGNRVSSGTFWTAQTRADRPACRSRTASRSTLGVKLGDTLTFDIAGNKVTARVTSLRKVDWDSFRVEFLRVVPARPARRDARDVHRGIPRAGGERRLARAARAEESEHPRHRHRRARAPGAGHHGPASRARSSSYSCSRSRAACSCCRRRSRRRRTSASSTRRSCARSARRRGSFASAQIAEFLLLGALAGARRGGGRHGDRLGARRPRVQDSVRGEPDGLGVRHPRRRDRGHARGLARHALDDAAAAARGDSPARLKPGPVREKCTRPQRRGVYPFLLDSDLSKSFRDPALPLYPCKPRGHEGDTNPDEFMRPPFCGSTYLCPDYVQIA